jgi:hypothetical protein
MVIRLRKVHFSVNSSLSSLSYHTLPSRALTDLEKFSTLRSFSRSRPTPHWAAAARSVSKEGWRRRRWADRDGLGKRSQRACWTSSSMRASLRELLSGRKHYRLQRWKRKEERRASALRKTGLKVKVEKIGEDAKVGRR